MGESFFLACLYSLFDTFMLEINGTFLFLYSTWQINAFGKLQLITKPANSDLVLF